MDLPPRGPAPHGPVLLGPVLLGPVLLGPVLGLLAVAELAARLTGGSAVRAGFCVEAELPAKALDTVGVPR